MTDRKQHWILGGGSVGCLYDFGPEPHPTLDSALDTAKQVYELDTDECNEVRWNGILYFQGDRRLEAGADYVQVSCEPGPCPCSDCNGDGCSECDGTGLHDPDDVPEPLQLTLERVSVLQQQAGQAGDTSMVTDTEETLRWLSGYREYDKASESIARVRAALADAYAQEDDGTNDAEATVYVVVSDVTPNRCTVVSVHDSESEAAAAAEATDTGINGMPAVVMRASSDHLEPGARAYHDASHVWTE